MEGVKGIENQLVERIRDTFRLAYMIHFLLGVGNLLPWNSLITAVDYFSHLYPTKHVEKVFSVAYMSSSLLVLVVMIMSWEYRWSKKLSYRLRMNLGFFLFVLALMVAPVMDWARNGSWMDDRISGNGGYGVTVVSIVICGLADGLVGGSLIGSAGMLPNEYMQAVFAGTASSGVLVSIMRIITKASLPQNPKGLQTSAHFYFIVGTAILLCCTLFFNLLFKLPIIQHHHRSLNQNDHLCPKPKFWSVASKIRWPAFGIFITYVVTLSIFPGFIAEDLESKLLGDWYPIVLIAIYNVGDLVGKSLTAVYVLKSMNKATWFCLGRVLFYPLYMASIHGPVLWMKSEVPVVVLTFMLGLTNGYLTSVLMICTPKMVLSSEAELSAIVMVVFLGIGLVCGSVVGWFWII